MLTELTYPSVKEISVISKIKDYVLLTKLRLTITVVFSAVLGYCMATNEINWQILFWLAIGGFMITAAANAFNQIIEKDVDKLMLRTMSRPLPAERMTINEAMAFAFAMALFGLSIMGYFISGYCAILGFISLLLYVLAYTPLKRISPVSVFVGAFPGAMPPLIGWVAASGQLSFEAWILFAIQFIWQFPHFWSIAWVLHDDYQKAGFKMLPSSGGKDKATAFQLVAYTLGLIPLSLLPYMFKMSGEFSAIVIFILGILFSVFAIKLYRNCRDAIAKKIMFFSFIYLPIVLLLLVLNKI